MGRKRIEDVVGHFWTYIDKTDTCWLWTGSKVGGYGVYSTGATRGLEEQAHRFAWQALVGEIPEAMELDHICGIRNCVNPGHLQLVEQGFNRKQGLKVARANQKARTHCKRGHEYTDENTYIEREGWRRCKSCQALSQKEYHERKRVAKTHCKRGHEFTDENTYVTRAGSRVCRKCGALRKKEYQERKRVAKTHCENGHEFTDENTHVRSNGDRQCRECWEKSYKEYQALVCDRLLQ